MLITTFVKQSEPQQWAKALLIGSHCVLNEVVFITAHPECQKAPRLAGKGQGPPAPPGKGLCLLSEPRAGTAGRQSPPGSPCGTRVPPQAQRPGLLINKEPLLVLG